MPPTPMRAGNAAHNVPYAPDGEMPAHVSGQDGLTATIYTDAHPHATPTLSATRVLTITEAHPTIHTSTSANLPTGHHSPIQSPRKNTHQPHLPITAPSLLYL
eukprot:857802-Pleurochrysis_carterae.AAC.2